MSSIKKVLCLKARNEGSKLFTTGAIYDVVSYDEGSSEVAWVNDDLGRKTFIFLCYPCIHGEWQPLEEYVCMTPYYYSIVTTGNIYYGYETDGTIHIISSSSWFRSRKEFCEFKKLSEINAEPKARHEVRHVVYDTKDNKIANDAMGECFIFLSEAQEVCDEMNAPKVMKSKYTKEVEYFGMKILVPDDAQWLSATVCGVVVAHMRSDKKPDPIYSIGLYIGCAAKEDVYVMAGVDLNGIDWKDTLVEIK